MTAKKTFQLIVVVSLLATSFAMPGSALAGGTCASYVTVQWGDTLNSIAATCGTTAEALQAANPGLGWLLYVGQVLYIPTGTGTAAPAPAAGGTYTVQWGDTLGNIAAKSGVSLSDLLAVNPQIWNINLIYPGQAINLPSGSSSAAPNLIPPGSSVTPVYGPTIPGYLDPNLYGKLKISYGYGLTVRVGPGKQYIPVDSIYVSAVKDSVWDYRKNSATIDSQGYVWVEVLLNSMAPYSTGWILVRDTLGKYYTEPLIDP
jgi:LysM repeat protein